MDGLDGRPERGARTGAAVIGPEGRTRTVAAVIGPEGRTRTVATVAGRAWAERWAGSTIRWTAIESLRPAAGLTVICHGCVLRRPAASPRADQVLLSPFVGVAEATPSPPALGV